MMKVIVTVVVTVVVTVLVALLGLWIIVRTGAINVAATDDFLPGAESFLETLSETSIRKQTTKAVNAGRITPPADVTEAMLSDGRHHYVEMCVVCHGAPGVDRGEIGAGLKPLPPEMGHVAEEMSIEEIYWVIENGIRHTGMPAYGATHSPEDMWAIAAFVEELGSMSPEEYQRQTSRPQDESEAHGHGAEESEPAATNGDGHEGHTH